MTNPYARLDRPPLSEVELRRALLSSADPYAGLWREISVVERTGSTNADVAEQARRGAEEGLVIVAEEQTAGRGRLGRQWIQPPRAGLAVSVLLRPNVPHHRWGWIPLLAGVAASRAITASAQLSADSAVVLKWPNDLLISLNANKVGGILAEVVAGGVVIGLGLNVSTQPEELPLRSSRQPSATSLALQGAAGIDRSILLRAILRALAHDYLLWTQHNGDPVKSGLRNAYCEVCMTLGQQVQVTLPNKKTISGEAVDIDMDGRLVVDTSPSPVSIAAGDIVNFYSE
jgi:BirA family transcriptional regulator, biotin operon repressor / biotin---[acetyl-CoA-carboxylase] ligase